VRRVFAKDEAAHGVAAGPCGAGARDLAAHGVAAGPCGAAALAAARNLPASPDATLVLIVTEGATANPALAP
jgi:hypothetical protein